MKSFLEIHNFLIWNSFRQGKLQGVQKKNKTQNRNYSGVFEQMFNFPSSKVIMGCYETSSLPFCDIHCIIYFLFSLHNNFIRTFETSLGKKMKITAEATNIFFFFLNRRMWICAEAPWLLLEWPARFRTSDGEYEIDDLWTANFC